jgi:hypothetical protein
MRIVLTQSQRRKVLDILNINPPPAFIVSEEILRYTEVSVENRNIRKIEYLEKIGFVKVYQGKHGSTWVHEVCLDEYLEDTKYNTNIIKVLKRNQPKKELDKIKDLLNFEDDIM